MLVIRKIKGNKFNNYKSYIEYKCDCGCISKVRTDNFYDGIKCRKCLDFNKGKDYTGLKYNRLTFLYKTKKMVGKYYLWALKCECGNIVYKAAHLVTFGKVKSCGCLKLQKASEQGKHNKGKANGMYGISRKGEKNPNWNPNLDRDKRIRKRLIPGYKEWRTAVFNRDNYTCQKCNIKGSRLQAHHIESYSECKEKRLIIDNGITLCEKCHKEFHSQFGVKNFNKDIKEWLNMRRIDDDKI